MLYAMLLLALAVVAGFQCILGNSSRLDDRFRQLSDHIDNGVQGMDIC